MWRLLFFLLVLAAIKFDVQSQIPTFDGPTPGTLRHISIPTVDISGETQRHVFVAQGTEKHPIIR